ncbi:MAG: hypothetical protein AAF413_00320 [Patescibacteria group bacterium]
MDHARLVKGIKIFALSLVAVSVALLGFQSTEVASIDDDDSSEMSHLPDTECSPNIILLYPNENSSTGGTPAVLSGVNSLIVVASGANQPIAKASAYVLNDEYSQYRFLTKLTVSEGSSAHGDWNTRFQPNGPNELFVALTFIGGDSCFVEAEYLLDNDFNFDGIEAFLNLSELTSPLNGDKIGLRIEGVVSVPELGTTSPNYINRSKVFWQTSLGTLQSNGRFAQLTPNQEGDGTVLARVLYGGHVAEVEMPFSVIGDDEESEEPSIIFPDTTENEQAAGLPDPADDEPFDEQPIIKNEEASNQDQVQTCIVDRIGVDEYSRIISGTRPSFEQYRRFVRCLSLADDIVPADIAPIAPDAIEEVQTAEQEELQTTEIINRTVSTDIGEQTAIELKGIATPNSEVLIYIFSDPLVLSTVSDSDGNWSYTLSNPLEPGEHEVYAVVETGDGVVQRSSALSFIVGTAEASADNPSGASLELTASITPSLLAEEADDRSQALFVIAAAVVVLLGAGALATSVWMNTKMKNT